MKLTSEQIDDLIEIWHSDDGPDVRLWAFLGWKEKDYNKWVDDFDFNPDSSLSQEELDQFLSLHPSRKEI